MDQSENAERVQTELELLTAMYPREVIFSPKRRELRYTISGATSASLVLRLPSSYPVSALPEVVSAHSGGVDVRNPTVVALRAIGPGEEALDAILEAFNEVVTVSGSQKEVDELNASSATRESEGSGAEAKESTTLTTIVWLHHLLATSKRKLALAHGVAEMSGISKPGYPGVMVFSGRASTVREHVVALKQMNWQAFQIRMEEEGQEEWRFAHGKGVMEVATMGEVVSDIAQDTRRAVFLEAMRMKPDSRIHINTPRTHP